MRRGTAPYDTARPLGGAEFTSPRLEALEKLVADEKRKLGIKPEPITPAQPYRGDEEGEEPEDEAL